MDITAFIGKSGTGKSYKSIGVARELGIEYIVDDGLLIKGNRLLAGKSAKSESSKIKAVKRALFMDEDHRRDVKAAIEQEGIERLLIIGTSDNMVEKIARALEIGEIDEKIYIESVSTDEEIAMARKNRSEDGKHIIPLPTFEIKKDFSGYFMDTLNVIKMKNYGQEVYEKTVVRPSFSYLGKYTISDKVIREIVKHIASKVDGVERAYRVYTENFKEGTSISVDIFVLKGYNIPEIGMSLQREIVKVVESMTSINILKVNVNVVRFKGSLNKNA
jgi:uncharacterized alkaline shock family protein YloU